MEIIALAAASLDGFITRGDEAGTAFTSQADKEWFGEVMKTFPIKIFGRKTFEVSKDYIREQSQDPQSGLRIVLTRKPQDFASLQRPGQLEFTDASASEIITALQERQLEDKRVAILGGGVIYSAFLNADLLDEFWITLEPQLFGSGTPIATEASNTDLSLKEMVQLGPSTLLLKYRCG